MSSSGVSTFEHINIVQTVSNYLISKLGTLEKNHHFSKGKLWEEASRQNIWGHVCKVLAVQQTRFLADGHWLWFFIIYSICISKDVEWSKTYDFEKKVQNKTKSFKNIFFLEHSKHFFALLAASPSPSNIECGHKSYVYIQILYFSNILSCAVVIGRKSNASGRDSDSSIILFLF